MSDYVAFHAGRLQNLGLSMMETMQESAAPMSPMLNDELTSEPQGGLEHIFFSTIMFHEVWVVAIFFFFPADVAGSVTPHLLIDMVEAMERECGTKVGHCSPFLQKVYKRNIVDPLWTVAEPVPENTSWNLCSNNSFLACVSEKGTHYWWIKSHHVKCKWSGATYNNFLSYHKYIYLA